MSRLTNIEKFFKKVNLSSDDELFVGVDVHKRRKALRLYRSILRLHFLAAIFL